MSQSVSDLAAGVAALPADRKKRRQRAFHTLSPPAPPQPLFLTPALSQGYFTPLPPQGQFGTFSPSPAVASPGGPMSPPVAPAAPAHAAPFFPPHFASLPVQPPSSRAGPQPGFQAGFQGGPQPGPQPGFQGGPQVSMLSPDAAAQANALSLGATRAAHQHEYTAATTADGSADGTPLGLRQFLSFQNVLPPAAGTQYQAVDQGTATPKHMRCTMYNVPETDALRRQTHLPVAVTIRPFAPQAASEEPVPVVDMAQLGTATASDPLDVGPPRCNRCRTYINPAMAHASLGAFTCNVCQFANNHVPVEYASVVDPTTGQRADRQLRAELHKGVYDIVVPPYYNVGGADAVPAPLHHVFMVDVSHHSVAKQLPEIMADAIRAAIYGYADDPAAGPDAVAPRVRFAIMLFDKNVHLYNLAPELETAHLAVSGDLDDPFVPFHHGLFADPDASRAIIDDALAHMEQLASAPGLRDPEPCFAAAVRTAAMCLDRVGGGKITAVLSTLPSWGPGGSKLKENRSVGRAPLAEAEKKLYAAENEYYKLLAKDLVAQNVGLDVFAVAATTVDMANIGWLASVTGGSIAKWSNFVFERDGRALTSQIVNSVNRCTGYQGQLKLRCSNGLQVAQYYGFSSANPGAVVGLAAALQDPLIPILTEDQSFTVLLEYDGTLNTKYDCHFQAALLYTDPQGVRKVRVINLVLAVTERLLDVFNFVDQDAVITTVVRDTLSFVGKEPFSELRNSTSEKLVQIYSLYRAMSEQTHNMNSTLTTQLIFPDSLKHLPAYFLALTKSKALRDSSAVSADSRLCDMYQMLNMPVERLVYHLYPALVELHSLQDDEGFVVDDPTNVDSFIKLPQFKSLSKTSLEHGVYILCNGSSIFVWIHPESNKLLLKDLFGEHVRNLDDIDPYIDSLPELPTQISQQARNLVNYFNKNIVGTCLVGISSIYVIREGLDSWAHEFWECLVEDQLPSRAVNTSPTLPDFLTSLHRAVMANVDAEKKNIKNSTVTKHDGLSLAQRLIHF